ncbi:MAG TPA: MdtA/MuxA family multidrug efflux RND transporter periplasmic adaptor subunit [Burkholderiales bacterium]|nr:MdtA/MuxA family multidrug efflux RND transporter periplasmic adaptor subunit [Burkholderiales bacterium]
MTKRNWALGIALAVLLAAGAGYYYQNHRAPAGASDATGKGGKGGRGGSGPVPVVAAAATTADVGVVIDALGSVTPIATVTVRSRVDGQLMKILFREGQMVRAGDLLAELDVRPYQAALDQAEATLARDRALLKNAQLDLERYKVLFQQDSVAKQQLDTQDSLVRQNEATVKMDLAAVETARLNVTYSRITAPVEGRVGLRQVDLGNIVHASDANGLVVITQLQPITAVFTIPEDSLPAVMKKLRAGEKLAAAAYDRAGKARLAEGLLLAADNQIDPTTGTVKLKAQFANGDLSLFPSQFVNVKLMVDVKHGATVVPSAAVQRGTPGTFVYAVNPETKTVSVQKVRLGPAQGEKVSIESGLEPGTLVVVDGADKLREGAAVELVVREIPVAKARKGGEGGGLSPEERLKRWQELNARIDKGEFGEEIRKLPEEERKQKMRELRKQKQQ